MKKTANNLLIISILFLLSVSPIVSNTKDLSSSNIVETTQKKVSLPKELFDNTPLNPTKVYDNLYCFGTKSVVVWALKTSDGIILIDSMWDNKVAEVVVNGMKEVGLDPKDIKYVLVTHGHGDHYGGAKYFKDNFGSKILMSEVDTDLMLNSNEGANGSRSPKVKVDEFVKDLQQITLGDTVVTIIATPGHTPGGISLIFPVKQDGTTYMAGLWGGTAFPPELKDKISYKNSINYFRKYTSLAKVTVELTAHLFSEDGYNKLEKAKNRKSGEKNPFDLGEKGFAEYLNNLEKSIDEAIKK